MILLFSRLQLPTPLVTYGTDDFGNEFALTCDPMLDVPVVPLRNVEPDPLAAVTYFIKPRIHRVIYGFAFDELH